MKILYKYTKNEVIKEIDRLHKKIHPESPLLVCDVEGASFHSYKSKDGGSFLFCVDYCRHLLFSIFDDKTKNQITEQNFKKEAEKWLKTIRQKSRGCTEDDYMVFLENIDKQIKSHTIYRKINGVFYNSTESETISIYTFNPTYNADDKIFQEISDEEHRAMMEHILCTGPTISISVHAFDVDSARKISEKYFLHVENILNINNKPNIKGIITILNNKDYESNNNFILSEDVAACSFSYGAKWYALDEKLKDPTIGDLLEISSKSSSDLTDIKKRVLIAVDWAGNGMRMRDTTVGFVCCVTAMESLLTKKGNGTMSPSLTAQLRDGITYLLCDGVDDRLAMHKKVGKIYDQRSKAIHGEADGTMNADFVEAYVILNNLINKFITSSEIIGMKSFEDLEQHILRRRYE